MTKKKRFEYFLMEIDLCKGKLPFIENYLSEHKRNIDFCDLWGYLAWLKNLHEKYYKNNSYESFNEFINRVYPISQGGKK